MVDHKNLENLSILEHQWLTLRGMVTLTKSVLQGIYVYLMHLFLLPLAIIHTINAIIAKFLWEGSGPSENNNLIKLGMLSCPQDSGGWGLRDTKQFNLVLLCCNLWRYFNAQGLWRDIILGKYFQQQSMEEWFVARAPSKCKKIVIWGNYIR